jgi:cephalosporin hydroxylase
MGFWLRKIPLLLLLLLLLYELIDLISVKLYCPMDKYGRYIMVNDSMVDSTCHDVIWQSIYQGKTKKKNKRRRQTYHYDSD